MNNAVLLYKDTPNPQGIPGEWPAETKPLGDSKDLPDDGRAWVLMSDEELATQFEKNALDKEAWNQANEASENQPQSFAIVKDGVVVDVVTQDQLIAIPADQLVAIGAAVVNGKVST